MDRRTFLAGVGAAVAAPAAPALPMAAPVAAAAKAETVLAKEIYYWMSNTFEWNVGDLVFVSQKLFIVSEESRRMRQVKLVPFIDDGLPATENRQYRQIMDGAHAKD